MFEVRRHHIDHITAHAKAAAFQFVVVTLVAVFHEPLEKRIAPQFVVHADRDAHFGKRLGRAEAVDARNTRDHDHVFARHERTRRRDAQALDLLVDRRIFLDVGVARRHVGLGLIVIVVTDEILDGVVGEKILKLRVELRRERLVVRDD